MNNRRGFFKKLFLLGAAAAVSPSCLAVADNKWKPNPAWATAKYEISFMEVPKFQWIPMAREFWDDSVCLSKDI